MKQSTHRSGKGNIKKKKPKSEFKTQQTKQGATKGQRNKLSYKDPISCKKHIMDWKGRET